MVRRTAQRFSMCTLVVLAIAAGRLDAQTASDVRLAEIFAGVGPSAPLQVVTPSFFVEDAYVDVVGERSVALTQNGTTVDVPYGDIRGVSTRDNHWLQGTIWGAAAGVLIGGVGGLMYASFTCTTPEQCETNERKGVVRGAAFLGGVGALGGFVLGRNSFYWRPVFP